MLQTEHAQSCNFYGNIYFEFVGNDVIPTTVCLDELLILYQLFLSVYVRGSLTIVNIYLLVVQSTNLGGGAEL